MSVEKAVDQVKVTGTAAPRARREFPAELRLRTGRESGGLFVAHMDKFHLTIKPQCVGHRIEAVAHDTVKPFDARICQSVNQLISDTIGHLSFLLKNFVLTLKFSPSAVEQAAVDTRLSVRAGLRLRRMTRLTEKEAHHDRRRTARNPKQRALLKVQI